MPNDLRSLTCPKCGAPLDFPPGQAVVQCQFCDSRFERSDDAPTADDAGHALKIDVTSGRVTVAQSSQAKRFVIKMQGDQPMVIEAGDEAGASVTTFGVSEAPRPAANRAVGCVVGVVALVAILGVLASVLPGLFGLAALSSLFGGTTAQGTPVIPGLDVVLTQMPGVSDMLTQVPQAATRYVVGRSAALVPALSDAPADLVVLATQYQLSGGEGEQRLLALSGADPALLWTSNPLDKDTYDTPLLADRDFLYAVSGSRLLALRRADGQTAWTVNLADELSLNLCADCLTLADGRLFALTDDGTLQAFDAASGAPLWKFEANQDSPRGLYLLAGRPAFMDRDEDSDGLLRAFDPASGEMQTAKPNCPGGPGGDQYADWTTPLHITPDGSGFYLLSGFFEFCVDRWDAATLTPVWQTKLPEDLSGMVDSAPLLITDDALYLVFGSRIFAVNAGDGALRPVLQDDDYTFVPQAVNGSDLLLRAKRQRGSTRYELWAVDAQTGEQRWSYDFGEAPPLDPPDANTSIIDEDNPVWTWRLTAEGLTILRFQRAADDRSHAILVERLDPQTGVSGGEHTVPLGIETIILSAPQVFGWERGILWFVIESQVIGFDVDRGQIVYRWP